jgi:lysozyme family protein
MADFDKAIKSLLRIEGEYVYDKVDVGNETYRGISRRYHPNWSGWIIVDAKKSDGNFPACLEQETKLHLNVQSFYKYRYWDLFWGSAMRDDRLATRMLNTAVHLGASRAVKYLQQALNVLNRNELLYANIVADGLYGERTHDALEKYLTRDRVDYLLKAILILQGKHYLDYMRRSPAQEKFARGWLKRLTMEVA